ncbi:glutamate ABC transporter substrate-binding protein [Glutamicibacter creatinolyticus]|uniref:ABC transporter glutamine-binding protein GlnH n=1 Tax=Glutamicibacter creatinolyticus TaxID=162496 RepID=A0A5B7WU77_9MICC|nr:MULTISPECIES: glutamate ABC transporter substrate-binding protein [Micrococcaceae]QCY47656.1 ABC transporter glutamine-binding protein GlnH precursor [Glutamicibacter creatinolyticus]TLK51152.1 glutamate ABC transporter substrate-binding protein [Glutamicibacter sp. V16R2B1]
MRKTRFGSILAMAAVAGLALTSCGGSGSDDAGSGDGGGEKVRIGIKFDQPGLGFKEGDEYTGFDVDVAKYVAKELGYDEGNIEFVSAPSANRETLLETNQVDMIFATYTINDARKERVAFAGPYFVAGQDLLVRTDDSTITGKDSLDGKNLCSVTGSTSAENVKKDIPGVNLVEQQGYADCLGLLETGGVDAITTDDIILAGLAATEANKGKFKVVGAPFSEEPYGVGLNKENDKCEDINTAIKKMIDEGEWEKALNANTEGTGYKPNAELNPPTEFEACS